MSLPTTQRAVTVLTKGSTHVVADKPLPTLNDDSALIKVKAIALNPTDWKHANALNPGSSIGCDFAGEIVQLGKNAENKSFKVGDAVSGFVRGGAHDKDNAAFQEYVRSPVVNLWRKPAALSFEDAAAMNIPLHTAAHALYYRLGVPKPWETAPSTDVPRAILVWAGSTSVGHFAIALAKLAGVPVVTTASPHNFDPLKKLGAEEVFDYKDPEAPAKIKKWAEKYGGLKIAFDTFSEKGSTKLTADALSDDGGKIATILPPQEGEVGSNIQVLFHLLYWVLEGPDKREQDFKDGAEWYSHLPELIEEGKVRNVIPTKTQSGLDGVPEGLNLLKDGKVSAQKLAYTLA
jgi:NADPH:quinone reductase-like Zn-dependent oxidoreductase